MQRHRNPDQRGEYPDNLLTFPVKPERSFDAIENGALNDKFLEWFLEGIRLGHIEVKSYRIGTEGIGACFFKIK